MWYISANIGLAKSVGFRRDTVLGSPNDRMSRLVDTEQTRGICFTEGDPFWEISDTYGGILFEIPQYRSPNGSE